MKLIAILAALVAFAAADAGTLGSKVEARRKTTTTPGDGYFDVNDYSQVSAGFPYQDTICTKYVPRPRLLHMLTRRVCAAAAALSTLAPTARPCPRRSRFPATACLARARPRPNARLSTSCGPLRFVFAAKVAFVTNRCAL